MTHDELLARISYHDEYYSGELMDALRAVVELHKSEPIAIRCPDGKEGCAVLHYSNKFRCTLDGWTYPCPTIQAIEKELS